MKNQSFVREYFAGTISTQLTVLEELGPEIEKAAETVISAMKKGKKWILFGNGGSASDAQHLAGEMVGRLYKMERRGLPAIALNTDTSVLTCIGNDYGYNEVFSRQIEALAAKGDVVMGISTSGNSPNVLSAFKQARKQGCKVIALGGKTGGKMIKLAHQKLIVPVEQTSHIQEGHIAIGHCMCFLIEQGLVKNGFMRAKKK